MKKFAMQEELPLRGQIRVRNGSERHTGVSNKTAVSPENLVAESNVVALRRPVREVLENPRKAVPQLNAQPANDSIEESPENGNGVKIVYPEGAIFEGAKRKIADLTGSGPENVSSAVWEEKGREIINTLEACGFDLSIDKRTKRLVLAQGMEEGDDRFVKEAESVDWRDLL